MNNSSDRLYSIRGSKHAILEPRMGRNWGREEELRVQPQRQLSALGPHPHPGRVPGKWRLGAF